MHTFTGTSWLTPRRLHVSLALLGGFLLLSFAAFAYAAGPDAKVAVDLIKINGADPAADRDNTFLGGETLTFKVTVTNKETDPGAGNTLTGTHGFSTNSTKLSVATPPPAEEQSITPGQNVEYEVTVQVAGDYSLDNNDQITRKVTASFTGNDNDDQDLTLRLYVPRLFITKTAAATVSLGASPAPVIPYTISITNDGAAPATNVVITDVLNARLVVPSPLPVGCTASGQTITCQFDSIPFNFQPSNPKTILFSPTVTGTACGITTKIPNQATVTADHLTTPVPSTTTQTTVNCVTPTPTPTPTPSATPAATPTPTPTPTTPTSTPTPTPASTSSSSSSSSTTGTGSGSSSSSSSSASTGRVAGATSGPSAADLKAPDYIPHAYVPLIVDRLFQQVFGRKVAPSESTCWKIRARSDKATQSKLKGAMAFAKSKGATGYTKTCQPPKLKASLVDDLFKIVYNRPPKASELKYWQKRHKDKPQLAALRGAMLFHKAQGLQH